MLAASFTSMTMPWASSPSLLSSAAARWPGLIPRAGQDRDALFRELTGCFETDAFIGAGNQGNFLGAHIDNGFVLMVEIGPVI